VRAPTCAGEPDNLVYVSQRVWKEAGEEPVALGSAGAAGRAAGSGPGQQAPGDRGRPESAPSPGGRAVEARKSCLELANRHRKGPSRQRRAVVGLGGLCLTAKAASIAGGVRCEWNEAVKVVITIRRCVLAHQ